MASTSRSDLFAWLVDLAAAATAATAAALCLLWLGRAGAAPLAGGGVLLCGFSLLRTVKPEPRRFRLPDIALPCWTDVLGPAEPLLLDRPLADNVHPLRRPANGERALKANPEASRAGVAEENVVLLSTDASAALRRSLGELRRSLA